MADLTIKYLKDLIDNLPDNAMLKVRVPSNGGWESVEVELIAYTNDNELLFLPMIV
jgi:hypothetical protein